MTVGQMLAHVAAVTHWSEQAHFVERKSDISGEQFGQWFGEIGKVMAGLTTKDGIVAALESRGDAFAARLETMTDAQLQEMVAVPGGARSRLEMLLGVKEHEMHHRAQLMQIERMLGVVPHLTRARQARA